MKSLLAESQLVPVLCERIGVMPKQYPKGTGIVRSACFKVI